MWSRSPVVWLSAILGFSGACLDGISTTEEVPSDAGPSATDSDSHEGDAGAGSDAGFEGGVFREMSIAMPAFVSSAECRALDAPQLTGEGSIPSSYGTVIAAWAWEIEERPAGSTVVLSDPSAPLTATAFADHVGVDLAGLYVFSLRVWDDAGRVSEKALLECAAPGESGP